MVEAKNLSKVYGHFVATADVSFRIRCGEIVCFLGPNGAGKSTTMKLLTGFLAPSTGTAKIAGHDMLSNRIAGAAHLGYLPENGPLYPDMTPLSFLRFTGKVRKMTKGQLEEALVRVIDICRLEKVVSRPISQLSRGYRQRVGMAQALLHQPDVLILDEPTAGLDPNQIHQVREAIRLIGKNTSILLSTHILQEVSAVASRVLFINKGRIRFDGSVKQFGEGLRDFDDHFRKLTEGE